MATIISSGNMTVDAIGQMDFSGSLIPHSWLHSITLDSGRPDMNAIFVLAEIVYWYRPTVSINEQGRTVWKKKFWKDYLQKSIRELAVKLNLSYDQVKLALVRLEKRGLIVKHIRTEIINGRKYGNVLYIEPVPEKLHELMNVCENCPDATDKYNPVCTDTGGCVNKNLRVSIQIPEAQDAESRTNTKSTTEITTTDFSSIVETRKEFMKQIDYESLLLDHPRKETQLAEIVELATEVLTSNKSSIAVNGEQRDIEYVKERFRKLDINSIKYVLECLGNYTGGAVNIRAFLITTLFNAPVTIDTYYELAVNHDLKAAN